MAASVHELAGPGAALFLRDLALVLGVAAVVTVAFRRLRQPVVLGYLLAGVIVGPHIPVPLFADLGRVHVLSEIGVVLVMFSIGLELSVRRLVGLLPTAGIAGLVQVPLVLALGHLAARALGWSAREAVFAGAMVAISSTLVIARTFREQKVPKALADGVFGLLVVQDLAAILLLALTTPLARGADLGIESILPTVGRLAAFLLGTVVVGFLVVPRAIRAVAKLASHETLVVAAVGTAFALALVAHEIGYSVALGAFLAGSLVAESGEGKKVEALVAPLRDVFAAVFFVSIGMTVEPRAIVAEWPAVLVFSVVVVGGQFLAGGLGALVSGADVRTSVRTGLCLGQIGEFSFILAGVGAASDSVRDAILPIAVAVSVITTFTTPWMVRVSDRFAERVEKRLPRPIATFVTLWASWIARLRGPRSEGARGLGRTASLLVADAVVLGAIGVGTSLGAPWMERFASRWVSPSWARLTVAAAASLVAVPFLVGLVRCARRIGLDLAGALSASPARTRALALVFATGVGFVTLVPLFAITQPFLPRVPGAAAGLLLVAIAVVVWARSALAWDRDVRAGVEVVADALARQGAEHAPHEAELPLPGVRALRLEPDVQAVGRTLAELDLHRRTGATVVAFRRGDERAHAPSAHARLEAGDVLALVGAPEAIDSAVALLSGPTDLG